MRTLTGTLLILAVAISWLFIWNEPSPAMQTTCSSGQPILAPMAAGKPKPIVPRPPEEMKVRACSRWMFCRAHIWCWPTSVVTIEACGSSLSESVSSTTSGAILPS